MSDFLEGLGRAYAQFKHAEAQANLARANLYQLQSLLADIAKIDPKAIYALEEGLFYGDRKKLPQYPSHDELHGAIMVVVEANEQLNLARTKLEQAENRPRP